MNRVCTSLKVVTTCICLLSLSLSATADMTYLVGIERTMYRVSESGATETFGFTDIGSIYSMCSHPVTGEVLATTKTPTGCIVHSVENAFSGTPELTQLTSLTRNYGSLSWIGNTLIGLSSGQYYELNLSDLANPQETLLGDGGLTDAIGGSAYDQLSDTFYVASIDYDNLYTVDMQTYSPSLVGAFGPDMGNLGMESYDGSLYMATLNLDNNAVELGSVNPEDGVYSTMFTLIPNTSAINSAAITVIPEPASALLLVCGLLIAGRRR